MPINLGFGGSRRLDTAPADTTGSPPTAAAGGFGLGLQIAGVLTSAIGGYYGVKAQQYNAKAAALAADFESDMAAFNARAGEQDAQAVLRAGRRSSGQSSLAYRQLKAGTRARRSARGVQSGVGNAAEVDASIEFAKESDRITINRNTIRAANARRLAAVGLEGRAGLARASAENLRSGARSLSPGIAAGSSLLAGSGYVAPSWERWSRPERGDD